MGGLNPVTRDIDLRDFFDQFGKLNRAYVIHDSKTKKSRCFGFLEFDAEESARAVLNIKNFEIHGHIIEVKFMLLKKEIESFNTNNQNPDEIVREDDLAYSRANSDRYDHMITRNDCQQKSSINQCNAQIFNQNNNNMYLQPPIDFAYNDGGDGNSNFQEMSRLGHDFMGLNIGSQDQQNGERNGMFGLGYGQ